MGLRGVGADCRRTQGNSTYPMLQGTHPNTAPQICTSKITILAQPVPPTPLPKPACPKICPPSSSPQPPMPLSLATLTFLAQVKE